MHPQAQEWLTQQITDRRLVSRRTLDLGGRDVNGTIHHLFDRVRTVDVMPGDGVDIVADAAWWQPDDQYQVVLCTEVFEHSPLWRRIIKTAWRALEPGGLLLATCASRSRPPHSMFDGGELRSGEWYQNIDPQEMRVALASWSHFDLVEADGVFGDDDLYVAAVK